MEQLMDLMRMLEMARGGSNGEPGPRRRSFQDLKDGFSSSLDDMADVGGQGAGRSRMLDQKQNFRNSLMDQEELGGGPDAADVQMWRNKGKLAQALEQIRQMGVQRNLQRHQDYRGPSNDEYDEGLQEGFQGEPQGQLAARQGQLAQALYLMMALGRMGRGQQLGGGGGKPPLGQYPQPQYPQY